MLRRKQIVTMVSIATISFLIGTTTINFAAASDGNPFDKIWEAINNLQARVTALEGSTNTKTWHFVTSFTLTPENSISSLFFIQGEKWRIKWEPTVVGVWYALIIFDENGYVIDNLDLTQVVYRHIDAKGIYYMYQGEGNYYIEAITQGANINFTIESYH